MHHFSHSSKIVVRLCAASCNFSGPTKLCCSKVSPALLDVLTEGLLLLLRRFSCTMKLHWSYAHVTVCNTQYVAKRFTANLVLLRAGLWG